MMADQDRLQLAARLRDYAKRLEDGEMLDEPGLAADLSDAAESLEQSEDAP